MITKKPTRCSVLACLKPPKHMAILANSNPPKHRWFCSRHYQHNRKVAWLREGQSKPHPYLTEEASNVISKCPATISNKWLSTSFSIHPTTVCKIRKQGVPDDDLDVSELYRVAYLRQLELNPDITFRVVAASMDIPHTTLYDAVNKPKKPVSSPVLGVTTPPTPIPTNAAPAITIPKHLRRNIRTAVNAAGCWSWKKRDIRDYSTICIGGKKTTAARVGYEMTHSPLPKGTHVKHVCGNRGCLNPEHLFVPSGVVPFQPCWIPEDSPEAQAMWAVLAAYTRTCDSVKCINPGHVESK